ncbi:MAG: PA2169 family four-helix-bundle protein [Phycisphaerales bacterium]
MAMTRNELEKKTIKKVQDLISINIDSEKGFAKAAENIEDASLADHFRRIGTERGRFARELQNYVEWKGEDAEDDGSLQGKMHRWWIDIRGTVQDGDRAAVLSEAERGEDKIKEMYEDTLKETAGSEMNSVLQNQYAAVKKAHDQIRDLRDAAKAAK